MKQKGNVLIIGNPDSSLVVERSKVPILGGYKVYWYSTWKPTTHYFQDADWLSGLIVPPKLPRGGRPAFWLNYYWTIFHLQPCIIHVHYALSSWPYARWIGSLHPLIVSVMGGDIMPDQGFHGEAVEPTSYLLEHADVITSKSNFLDQRLLEIGPFQHKLRRVTWGMDIEQFKPGLDVSELRQRLNLEADDIVFFCARACELRTNKHQVIQAFSGCLSKIQRSAKLLVSEYIGVSSEYCAQLHKLVDDLGICEHVRFISEVPYHEMPLYMNLADAVISVPRSDGMPQTLYQAMSCGTYSIISDIPQTHELLELGAELSLTPVNDVDAIACSMEWVVNNHKTARQIGLRNRDRVLKIANQAEQTQIMNEIYDELLPKTWFKRLGF